MPPKEATEHSLLTGLGTLGAFVGSAPRSAGLSAPSSQHKFEDQARLGLRTGARGLEENEDASQRLSGRFVLPGRSLSAVRLALPRVCCEQDG
jgi:hypothetical protein